MPPATMKQEKGTQKEGDTAPIARGANAGDDDDSAVSPPPPPPFPPPLLHPAQVRQLCTHGYVGIALPHHLAAQYEALRAGADAFFAQPLAAKAPYAPGAARGPPCSPTNTERGYSHLPGEKEFLTVRRSLSFLPPGPIPPAAAAVWHDSAHLLLRILGDLALHLGLDPRPLWDLVHDSLVPAAPPPADAAGTATADALEAPEAPETVSDARQPQHPHHPRHDPPTLLRLFRYAPGGGGAEQHRDLGMLTLCVCWGKGLQVRPVRPPVWRASDDDDDDAAAGGGGAWHPQDPAPWEDAPRVTVMAGDTLHLFTQGRVPSALHRVVVVGPDEADGAAAAPAPERRSIVFALRATTEGAIDARLLGGAAGETINARELYDTIRHRRVNINTGKDTREAMRSRNRAEQHGGVPGGPGPDRGPIGVA